MRHSVEELARWFHVTTVRGRGREWLRRGKKVVAWGQLPEWRKDDYRFMALAMLSEGWTRLEVGMMKESGDDAQATD